MEYLDFKDLLWLLKKVKVSVDHDFQGWLGWTSLWIADKNAAELSFNFPCKASAICILLRLCAENCPIFSQY